MGHFEYANEMYKQVLSRRPNDAAALKGLAILLNLVRAIPTFPRVPIPLSNDCATTHGLTLQGVHRVFSISNTLFLP